MREALTVWTPFFERLIGLFLETVEGEVPSLRRGDDGSLAMSESGRVVVHGGWPCQRYSEDWRARARVVPR